MLSKAKQMKIKQFFKNPVYLLAVIASLAVVSVVSAVAVKAFADGNALPSGLQETTAMDYYVAGVGASNTITVKYRPTDTVGATIPDTVNWSTLKANNAVGMYNNEDGDFDYDNCQISYHDGLNDASKTVYTYNYDAGRNAYYHNWQTTLGNFSSSPLETGYCYYSLKAPATAEGENVTAEEIWSGYYRYYMAPGYFSDSEIIDGNDVYNGDLLELFGETSVTYDTVVPDNSSEVTWRTYSGSNGIFRNVSFLESPSGEYTVTVLYNGQRLEDIYYTSATGAMGDVLGLTQIDDSLGNHAVYDLFNGSAYSASYLPVSVTVQYDCSEYDSKGTLTNTPGDFSYSNEIAVHSWYETDSYLEIGEFGTESVTLPTAPSFQETGSSTTQAQPTSWKRSDDTKFSPGSAVTFDNLLKAGTYSVSESGGIHFTIVLTPVFTTSGNNVSYSATDENGDAIDLTDEETYGTTYKTKSYAEGSTVTVADKLTKDGYTFKGWSLPDGHGIAEADITKSGDYVTSFKMPGKNINLTGEFEEKNYTLTYDKNLAAASDPTVASKTFKLSECTKVGTTYTYSFPASDTSATGYTFSGWSENGNAPSVTSITVYPDTETYTVKGIWTKNPYTLNYHANLTGVTDPVSETFFADDTNISGGQYTFPTKSVSKDGYTFKGWGTAANAITTVTAIDFNENTDTYDVYGVWQNTVTYQDGYTNDTTQDKTYDVITGQSHSIIANPFTRTGYTFAGWQLVSPASGYATSGSITVNENVTYQATWTVNQHNVTYTVSGDVPTGYSTASLNKTNMAYGTSVTVAAAPDIEGYTFAGWTTSDVTVSGGTFTMPDKNVTLAGVFTKNPEPAPTYTLIYNCNTATYPELTGLTGAPADETLTAASFTDGQYQLTTAYPDSDNFRFVCWSRTKNYSVANIVEKVAVSDFNAENQCEVYAIWVAKLDVTYKCGIDESDPAWQYNKQTINHVFELDHYTLNYRVLDNEELDQPFVYPGHRITKWRVVSGWDKIEFPSQPSGGSSATAAAPAYRRSGSGDENHYLEFGTMIILHGDVEVEAVWEEIPVTLTYHANGGSPESAVPNSGNSINHMIDDKVTVQDGSGLTKSGLVFAYWSTTPDDVNGSKHYNKNDTFTIQEDTDLYAIYKTTPDSEGGKEYTVTYDPNGGTGTTPSDSNKYQGGETVTVKDKGDLVRTNATFKEWNTKKDGSGTGYKGDGTATFTMPESNVTLYAIWVDSSGNILPSPRTGESDMPMMFALNMALIALLTAGFALMNQYNRRRKTAN